MCKVNYAVCEDKPKWDYDGHESVLREGIELIDGKICHNGNPCTFKFNKDKITIGCHTITPEAMRFILSQWDAKFLEMPTEFVVQP